MALIGMAYIVMAYIVMACVHLERGELGAEHVVAQDESVGAARILKDIPI